MSLTNVAVLAQFFKLGLDVGTNIIYNQKTRHFFRDRMSRFIEMTWRKGDSFGDNNWSNDWCWQIKSSKITRGASGK